MSIRAKGRRKPPTCLFSVRNREAREVILTGEFTEWARDRVRLVRDSNGDWRTRLDLAPGEYQYRLIVDGEWSDHPEATKRVPNPFGTENCVLIIAN